MNSKKIFILQFLLLSLLLNNTCLADTRELISPSFLNTLISDYPKEEKKLIKKDLHNIRDLVFGHTFPKNIIKPSYVATAGPPGAIKSTILETYVHNNPDLKKAAYIDPDQRGIKFMINTYIAKSLNCFTISQTPDYAKVQKHAYDYWRDASNYIAGKLLNQAFRKRYSIVHGTTSTGKIVETHYKTLHSANYYVTLLLCFSLDSARLDAIEYRNTRQGFYQQDEQDIFDKDILFMQRVEAYFNHADEMVLYWTEKFREPAIAAATYKDKKLTIHNEAALNKIIKEYNRKIVKYSLNSPTWQEIIKKFAIQVTRAS